MSLPKIVSPEFWYCAFWSGWFLVFLSVLLFPEVAHNHRVAILAATVLLVILGLIVVLQK